MKINVEMTELEYKKYVDNKEYNLKIREEIKTLMDKLHYASSFPTASALKNMLGKIGGKL